MTVSLNLESLSASFPLTLPVPTPLTHPSLISAKDLHREEDLLRNPFSFRQWWSAIYTTREAQNALVKLEPVPDIPPETRALLGSLASPVARQALQLLTYLYEAALANFPGSYKLWKSYLQMRMSFVLGKQIVKKKAGGKKRLPDIKDALEQEDLEQWEGGLDGVVGWEEWKALVATLERALMWLPKVC
jgi:pre-mRNA-splicing factor SYF1